MEPSAGERWMPFPLAINGLCAGAGRPGPLRNCLIAHNRLESAVAERLGPRTIEVSNNGLQRC